VACKPRSEISMIGEFGFEPSSDGSAIFRPESFYFSREAVTFRFHAPLRACFCVNGSRPNSLPVTLISSSAADDHADSVNHHHHYVPKLCPGESVIISLSRFSHKISNWPQMEPLEVVVQIPIEYEMSLLTRIGVDGELVY
jgi:hypothetical protein